MSEHDSKIAEAVAQLSKEVAVLNEGVKGFHKTVEVQLDSIKSDLRHERQNTETKFKAIERLLDGKIDVTVADARRKAIEDRLCVIDVEIESRAAKTELARVEQKVDDGRGWGKWLGQAVGAAVIAGMMSLVVVKANPPAPGPVHHAAPVAASR